MTGVGVLNTVVHDRIRFLMHGRQAGNQTSEQVPHTVEHGACLGSREGPGGTGAHSLCWPPRSLPGHLTIPGTHGSYVAWEPRRSLQGCAGCRVSAFSQAQQQKPISPLLSWDPRGAGRGTLSTQPFLGKQTLQRGMGQAPASRETLDLDSGLLCRVL